MELEDEPNRGFVCMFVLSFRKIFINLLSVLVALNIYLSLPQGSGDHLTSTNNWQDPERNYF